MDRMSKPTFSGDPLVRLKQFIEAAETPRAQARTRRVNVRMKRVTAPVVAVGSRGAKAVEKSAAGKDEQDDCKLVGKAGKFFSDVVKKRENSSRLDLMDSMQAVGRVRLSTCLISFHVCSR